MSVAPAHICVFVPGIPQPGGSKRAFPFKRRNGSLGVAVSDNNPKVHGWRDSVKAAVIDSMQGQGLAMLHGPLRLTVEFTMPRLKGHYSTSKRTGLTTLKKNVETWHTTRPDATKLMRAVEDALNGIAWRDDTQVCEQRVTKLYGEQVGARIRIESLQPEMETA